MKLSILLVCLALVAAESFTTTKGNVKVADKNFLQKQKFILEILHNVHEPLAFEEYLKESKTYVMDKSAYTNFEDFEEFFDLYKQSQVPKNKAFSVFDGEDQKEAIALYKFFYSSKDWTTFYKNVIWARVHINEGVFVYALTMAVLHREDTQGIVLPAPYEIYPYMFFSSDVIKDAYEFRTKYMQDKTFLKKEYPIKYWESKYFYDMETKKDNVLLKDYDLYYLWSNYTSDYYYMNEEYKLDYFREDIDLNSFYYYFHMDYPFWMESTDGDLLKDRRGEKFLYFHQQLLARYYMERLSQNLGEIPEFSYYKSIPYGYNSNLMYSNGQGVTIRKNYYEIYNTEEYYEIQKLLDYERRIHDIIDYGFYKMADGTQIDMRKPTAIEYIGNFVQKNPDSLDSKFFGMWLEMSHWLMGGALSNYETALRDPFFYMLYKRVVKSYYHFKQFLPSYKYEELFFKGVEINNVDIEKIYTYFDSFDADLTTLMGHEFMFEEHDVMLKARQMQLTYKPFYFNLDVTSDKAQKVVIRSFVGPKFNQFGKLYTFEESRENFYEFDQFVYDLPAGKSVIKKYSMDISYTIKDRTTYTELYKTVMLAIDGKIEFPLDMSEAHCGYPNRLVFPKGWSSGMPVQFFFIISPYIEPEVPQYSTYDSVISCGVGSGSRYIDNQSFGYPLDRDVYNYKEFFVPNMYFADAKIYHTDTYEDFNSAYVQKYNN